MSGPLRLLFVALTAILLSASASAQTVDEIVAKNLEARGGVERLKTLDTVVMTGTILAQGMELPVTTWTKRPNRIRRETVVKDQRTVVGFDGTTAWTINPMSGSSQPQPITGPQFERTRDEASIDPLLLGYREKGHSVELVGTETVAGTKAHHLRITKKSGAVEHYYIDAGTSLETRIVSTLEQGGIKAEVTTDFSDYQVIEGLPVPFRIRQSINGRPVLEVKFEKVQFNVPLDDEMFRMPK